MPNGTRFVANISIGTLGLPDANLSAALGEVVRQEVLNRTAAAEDRAAVWVNTTIVPNVSRLALQSSYLPK
jgi:hypothetical protein